MKFRPAEEQTTSPLTTRRTVASWSTMAMVFMRPVITARLTPELQLCRITIVTAVTIAPMGTATQWVIRTATVTATPMEFQRSETYCRITWGRASKWAGRTTELATWWVKDSYLFPALRLILLASAHLRKPDRRSWHEWKLGSSHIDYSEVVPSSLLTYRLPDRS